VFRLDADAHAALTSLGRLLRRPLNALVNDAVRSYLLTAGQEERELEGTLAALQAYRERKLDVSSSRTDHPIAVVEAEQSILDAAREFVQLASSRHPVKAAFLFGSRARGTHREDSDVDIALLLGGDRPNLMQTALALADIAFEVLLSRNVYIQPLPIWEGEWDHPDRHENPRLIENIRREGRVL